MTKKRSHLAIPNGVCQLGHAVGNFLFYKLSFLPGENKGPELKIYRYVEIFLVGILASSAAERPFRPI